MTEFVPGWEERLLAAAAEETAWPPTPDLRARVLTAIPNGRPVPVPNWRPRLLAAALAVLALLVATTLAIPSARTAVAEFFGLVEGYRIEFVATPTPDAAQPSATSTASTPSPTPTRVLLENIAARVTLEEAAARLGYTPALPASEGEPEVYLMHYGGQPVVVLRYPRFDLWQRRGDSGFFSKSLPADTPVDIPSVDGDPGYWIPDVERTVRFIDADGNEVPGSARAVQQNTLIWRTAETFYRIETDLSLEEVLPIASSLP